VEGLFSGIGTAFTSKTSLLEENRNLKIQLADINAKLLSYDSVVAENTDLKASMGRADTMHLALATILSKPSSSAYDTLLIDGGEKALFVVGETVYANGEIPIGKIEHVDVNTALVRLYSSPKFTTEARLDVTDEKGVKHIDVTLTGRGGGNFQTSVPHDLKVESGTQVFSKELKPHLMAIFQKVTSDARDPFQTMLLSSPVNIQELSFVEVGQ
jgi:cell shape-determining protein MreC